MTGVGATFEVTADVAAGKLGLCFQDREAVRGFFAEARAQQGFMVPLPERPRQVPAVLARAEVAGLQVLVQGVPLPARGECEVSASRPGRARSPGPATP